MDNASSSTSSAGAAFRFPSAVVCEIEQNASLFFSLIENRHSLLHYRHHWYFSPQTLHIVTVPLEYERGDDGSDPPLCRIDDEERTTFRTVHTRTGPAVSSDPASAITTTTTLALEILDFNKYDTGVPAGFEPVVLSVLQKRNVGHKSNCKQQCEMHLESNRASFYGFSGATSSMTANEDEFWKRPNFFDSLQLFARVSRRPCDNVPVLSRLARATLQSQSGQVLRERFHGALGSMFRSASPRNSFQVNQLALELDVPVRLQTGSVELLLTECAHKSANVQIFLHAPSQTLFSVWNYGIWCVRLLAVGNDH